jgi:hypothetical protein
MNKRACKALKLKAIENTQCGNIGSEKSEYKRLKKIYKAIKQDKPIQSPHKVIPTIPPSQYPWDNYNTLREREAIHRKQVNTVLAKHSEEYRKRHPNWLEEYEKGNFDFDLKEENE